MENALSTPLGLTSADKAPRGHQTSRVLALSLSTSKPQSFLSDRLRTGLAGRISFSLPSLPVGSKLAQSKTGPAELGAIAPPEAELDSLRLGTNIARSARLRGIQRAGLGRESSPTLHITQ